MQRKVLIVDDNALVRKLAKQLLMRNGYEAVDCETPFEVLHKLHEFQPDVVLLDMMMPGLSGTSVAQVIRKHVTYGDTKIVMFSSLSEHQLNEHIVDGLADACFTKTEDFAGLCDTIERVINSSTH